MLSFASDETKRLTPGLPLPRCGLMRNTFSGEQKYNDPQLRDMVHMVAGIGAMRATECGNVFRFHLVPSRLFVLNSAKFILESESA